MTKFFFKILTLFVLLNLTFSFYSCKNEEDDEEAKSSMYIPTTYTITLNANGGTLTGKSNYTVSVGDYWRIPEASSIGLKNSPKYFQGWAKTSSSTKVAYADNYRFQPQSDLTLYAVWGDIKQETYTANSSKSLQSIIDEINYKNIDSDILESKTAYTIYIDGELSGTTKIQDGTNVGLGRKIKLAESITLIGRNDNDRLTGGDSKTILFISSEAPIMIKNLAFSGGKGTFGAKKNLGGAIYIEGTSTNVTIGENVLFLDNTAENGGAIYINTGTLTINTDITMKENTAENGGAIYNDNGSVVINGGTITANTASFNGGGIYNKGSLSINGGTISLNKASLNGGGLYTSSAVSLEGGRIESNEAENGGGIFIDDGTVTNSANVIKNKAKFGAGVYNKSEFAMRGGSVSQNEASEDGGGVYNSGSFTMTGGNVSFNTAIRNGGGLLNSSGSIEFNNGSIDDNKAKNGGGIFNNGISLIIGTYTLVNGKDIVAGGIRRNSASEKGGAIYNMSGSFTLNTGTEPSGEKISAKIEDNIAPDNNGKTWYKAGGSITIKETVQSSEYCDSNI